MAGLGNWMDNIGDPYSYRTPIVRFGLSGGNLNRHAGTGAGGFVPRNQFVDAWVNSGGVRVGGQSVGGQRFGGGFGGFQGLRRGRTFDGATFGASFGGW